MEYSELKERADKLPELLEKDGPFVVIAEIAELFGELADRMETDYQAQRRTNEENHPDFKGW